MKRTTLIGLIAVALLLTGGGVVVWQWPREPAPARPVPAPASTREILARTRQAKERPEGQTTGLSPAERAARVERIRRDYDEVRTKTAADYAAAGTAFPGGLNAFLRQLALLERELHADYAAVLSPRELEDLEMRETPAGQLVQKLLGDTAATEEQRRAAFRLQREFDEKFALTFDLGAATLLTRETERQATQERIRAAIGDELFAAWLGGEGSDFASFTAFTTRQGLPADAPLALWRAKNDYTLRRLALNAQRDLLPEQTRAGQAALVQSVRARLLGILGPGGLQAAGPEVIGWLPPGK